MFKHVENRNHPLNILKYQFAKQLKIDFINKRDLIKGKNDLSSNIMLEEQEDEKSSLFQNDNKDKIKNLFK